MPQFYTRIYVLEYARTVTWFSLEYTREIFCTRFARAIAHFKYFLSSVQKEKTSKALFLLVNIIVLFRTFVNRIGAGVFFYYNVTVYVGSNQLRTMTALDLDFLVNHFDVKLNFVIVWRREDYVLQC